MHDTSHSNKENIDIKNEFDGHNVFHIKYFMYKEKNILDQNETYCK